MRAEGGATDPAHHLLWWAGAEDARRSRLRQGLPERVEDPAAIAVLAALLRTARSTSNQESTGDDTQPAA